MTATQRFAILAAIALAAALALVACAPIRTLNALTRGDTYQATSDVAYGPLARHKLDIYAPVGAAPASGWAVVVFLYGGSWNSGELADYRLYPEVRYPSFLEDSARAMAWGLEHAAALGGDPHRVFVMGHSAGGYNAAMLALDPRWLAGVGHRPGELAGWIGLAGAYEFLPLGPDSPARPVFFHPDYPPGTQPIDDVTRDSPKAFLAAPLDDKVVSPQRSTLAMAAKLRGAGVPVELHLYEGITHSLLAGVFARPLRGLAPARDDLSAWINAN